MQIDKNAPLPTSHGRGRPAAHPINSLAAGESFLCPPEMPATNVRMLIQYHQRKGKKYTTRTTPEGLRVWRIK